MFDKTISLEMLAIGAKTPLVNLCANYVKDMRKTWENYPSISGKPDMSTWSKLTQDFVDNVKRVFGVSIRLDLYTTGTPLAGVVSALWFNGHSGSRYYTDPAKKIIISDDNVLNETILIDLKNVKITGKLADALGLTMYYSDFMMFDKSFLTDDEMTAVLLHEFGHVLNTFMTLGDYAWLNYYLTDGIDIMLGKKQNKLKLHLFNQRWLDENVPKDIHEAYANDRNEETARRVVLAAIKKAPRHHLTDNGLLANRREEQLADMFATRLGYGRQLVSANYKIDKYLGDPQLNGRLWYAETAKVLTALVLLPVAVIGMMMYDPLVHESTASKYDDPLSRIIKVRRDLVAQLKNPGPLNKDDLVADIEAIDSIIKEYSNNTSLFDGLTTFLRPSIRKQRQNTKAEDDIESLMNNDLFLQAHKLSKL